LTKALSCTGMECQHFKVHNFNNRYPSSMNMTIGHSPLDQQIFCWSLQPKD